MDFDLQAIELLGAPCSLEHRSTQAVHPLNNDHHGYQRSSQGATALKHRLVLRPIAPSSGQDVLELASNCPVSSECILAGVLRLSLQTPPVLFLAWRRNATVQQRDNSAPRCLTVLCAHEFAARRAIARSSASPSVVHVTETW